jgi:hypothetical protein
MHALKKRKISNISRHDETLLFYEVFDKQSLDLFIHLHQPKLK